MWTEVVHPLQHNAARFRNAGASLEAESLCSCVLKSIIQGCFSLSEWKKTRQTSKSHLISLQRMDKPVNQAVCRGGAGTTRSPSG